MLRINLTCESPWCPPNDRSVTERLPEVEAQRSAEEKFVLNLTDTLPAAIQDQREQLGLGSEMVESLVRLSLRQTHALDVNAPSIEIEVLLPGEAPSASTRRVLTQAFVELFNGYFEEIEDLYPGWALYLSWGSMHGCLAVPCCEMVSC